MYTFTLSKPIKDISELQLDFDSLSMADIKTAEKVKSLIIPQNTPQTSASPRLDHYLQFGIAWAAALKANKDLILNDALLLSAKDTFVLAEVALTEYLF